MQLQIGFVLHAAFRALSLQTQVATSAELAQIANVVAPRVTPGMVGDLAPLVASTRQYITNNGIDVLFLEWNLGNGGQTAPTFDRAFFEGYPDVRFVMITGTSLPQEVVAAANLPPNVDMQLAGQLNPLITPVVPKLVKLAGRVTPLAGDTHPLPM
jgi:hypothetical protein